MISIASVATIVAVVAAQNDPCHTTHADETPCDNNTKDYSALTPEDRISQLNESNPFAEFSMDAYYPENVGGCYVPPPPEKLLAESKKSKNIFKFTKEELEYAQSGPDIDWRDYGAVGPIQQQHPFGTCWAFSMTAVTEAINVIQGKNKFSLIK